MSLRQRLLIVAVLLVIPTSGIAQTIALFDGRLYDVMEDNILERTCKEQTPITYKVLGIDEKNRKVRIKVDGKILRKSFTADRIKYHGVDALSFLIKDYPAPGGGVKPLQIIENISEKFGIRILQGGTCPDAGLAPRAIHILIDPERVAEMETWAAARSINVIAHDRPQNYYYLEVPTGYEDTYLNEIKKTDWLIDAIRDSYGAGPDEVFLKFPLKTFIGSTRTQNDIKNYIYNTISKAFSNYRIEKSDVLSGSGFRYFVKFNGNAEQILSDPLFRDYWLQAKVRIEITTTGDVDGPSADRVIVSVPDGFLPVWPSTKTSPPPEGHVDEFQLRPGAYRSKFRGFYSLEKLQSIIGIAIAEDQNGEVDINPFANRKD